MEDSRARQESTEWRESDPQRRWKEQLPSPVDDVSLSTPSPSQQQAPRMSASLAVSAEDLSPLIPLETSSGSRHRATNEPQTEERPTAPPATGPIDLATNGGHAQHDLPNFHNVTGPDDTIRHSTHSVGDAASQERRSLRPEKSHADGHASDQPTVQPWKGAIFAWWQELLWCLLSIVSVAALAAVLSYFDEKPLPAWPLGLTLNTVIALLATLARTAFIVPVSEGLSQLKWLWYRSNRPLKHFQDFDAASRGLWGSVQLSKTTKGW